MEKMVKKSFTILELIFVIVILGIISSITFDILSKMFKNYIYAKEMNNLNAKLDATMEVISMRLKDRIQNTMIVTKYPSNFDESNPNSVDFKSFSKIKPNDGYNVLEWINKDYEAKNGMWDYSTNHIQTGWSGFVDLSYDKKTNSTPQEFNITTPDSNFTIVKLIDRNISTAMGDSSEPFLSRMTTIIFSGIDGGGDLVDGGDLNNSYGWYYKEDKNRTAKVVFAIQQYGDYKVDNTLKTDLNITPITEHNKSVTLYERYYVARSAYALVPIENNETLEDGRKVNDYNLTFVYNYQPWQQEWYKDGNRTVLATHVTEIRFAREGNSSMMRLYLCMQSPTLDVNGSRKLTLCKEKAIY